MELFPSHMTLNGQSTPVEELLAPQENKPGWEQDWLNFLAEWYNPRDYIEVNTSGSTGEPKTIALKKDFVAASALRTIRYFELKPGDRILHCLPSRYIAGKLMLVRALIGQLDLYPIDPSTDFSSTAFNQPFQFSAMVINQATKLLQAKKLQLANLLLGGSAIPAPLEQELQELPTRCFSSYAMTETATHIALRELSAQQDGYYHCLDGIQVRLNENGCLRIEMPGLENGFLQTTDLAELRNNKTFRILGRADHRIISGGLKFSPEELEKKLEKSISLPFYISSKTNPSLGRQLVLVAQADETPALISRIQESCQRQLDRYEQPREIIFVKELPRTPNGKIKRLPAEEL